MSYYYNYYIGYEKNGKIYPWGPYTAKGELRPVISKSRADASDLHYDFRYIEEEKISDELREKFEYKDWDDNKKFEVQYLTVKELPIDSFIRKGYFLIEDIRLYEKTQDTFDLFYDYLTPEMYAIKLQYELMLGKNLPKKDCEGVEYIEPNASDYMYYAYPDYNSKEYESFVLRETVEALRDYDSSNDIEYVILETEG